MRNVAAGLVAGVVLGSAAVATAAIGGGHTKAYTLLPGQAVTFAGLTCTAYNGTTSANANIVCVRNDLAGYGVVVSKSAVVVAKRVGGKVKVYYEVKNR